MAHPPITLQSAVATLTAGRCAQLFAVIADDPARLGEAELGEVVAGLLRARAAAEAALYALTREAEERGVIAMSTAANPAQWINARAAEAEVPVTDAALVQQAVAGTRAPGMALLAAATSSARIPVASCAAVTRVWGRIHALIEPADQDEALRRLTERAAAGASIRTLSQLGEELLATFAIEGIYDDLTDRRAQARSMSPFRYQSRTGLYTATVRLDAASTSLVESVIGALAAPAPASDDAVDWRNTEQRRADALIEACALVSTHTHELGGLNVPRLMAGAVAAAADSDVDSLRRVQQESRPGGSAEALTDDSDDEDVRQQVRIAQVRAQEREAARVATAPARGTAAQMRVTIPLDWLTDHLIDTEEKRHRIRLPRHLTGDTSQRAGDRARHIVTDEHGILIPATDLRRLACEADLIPIVLAGPSQPLDVGRSRRLATPAQRTALTIRDRGCTFPGCDRPPSWCRAHHIAHWNHGGPTDLDNLTLLCQRHHTIVHRDHLTATLVPGPDGPRIHWALPGLPLATTRAA